MLVKDEQLNRYGENKRYSDYWGTYDHVGGSAKYSEAIVSSSCPDKKVLNTVVEYWLPDSPNHIIRQGIVNFVVTGRDITAPVIDWYKFREDNTVMVKFTEGSEITHASVKLLHQKDPSQFIIVDLNDSGLDGDLEKNDRVFSYKLPLSGFGFYSAEINAADIYSNSIKLVTNGPFVIH